MSTWDLYPGFIQQNFACNMSMQCDSIKRPMSVFHSFYCRNKGVKCDLGWFLPFSGRFSSVLVWQVWPRAAKRHDDWTHQTPTPTPSSTFKMSLMPMETRARRRFEEDWFVYSGLWNDEVSCECWCRLHSAAVPGPHLPHHNLMSSATAPSCIIEHYTGLDSRYYQQLSISCTVWWPGSS